MSLTLEQANYFWLRSLEGQASVERAIGKWNKGFPDTPVTIDGVNEFLSEMIRFKSTGLTDWYSMEKILGSMIPAEQPVVDKKPVEIVTEIKEFKAPVTAKKRWTGRKKKA